MTISEKALKRMPAGKFVRFENVEDRDRQRHDAVLWRFGGRLAYFDIETGEYLGEGF